MNRLYILILVIIWTIGPVEAQSLKQFKTEAVKATQKKDFRRSFSLYEKIINEANEKTPDIYFKAAESARQFRLYAFAEEYYKEVVKDTFANNHYRLTSYYLGIVLKSQAKYDEAIGAFNRFIERDAAHIIHSGNFTEKAKKEIEDCKWAKMVTENGAIVVHLDSTVNTPDSEFGPFEYDSTLYYTSVRYETDNKYEPIPPLARLYSSDQLYDGKELADDFNLGEKLHTGNIAFNADQSRVYYTICKNIDVSNMRCKIYFRDKNGDNWGPVDTLSNVINSNTYTATRPSIGVDRETGKELLFFVSDRLVDTTDYNRNQDLNIWCSIKEENGEWGEPGYIDSVNTDGDDVTPFFHTVTQTLYFSSNGLQNLGGFDIYSVQKNGSEWGKPKGMGTPINTSYDELYYTINAEGSMAYMSSNRPGGSCDPKDSLCVCNDIYRIPQICLEIRTFNKLTALPLFGTEVILNETNMNAATSQLKEDSHIYNFFVGFGRSYTVDGTKLDSTVNIDGTKLDSTRWLPDMEAFNTNVAFAGECDTIDLFLEPLVNLDVSICEESTGKPLPGAKVEISVVDGSDTGFPKSDQNDASSDYHFDLNFGKKYKIVASKPGYSTKTSFRIITEDIERVPFTLKEELCLPCKPLPPLPKSIKLYFDHDMPGPHTSSATEADTDYSQLANLYKRKKSLFQRMAKNAYGDVDSVGYFFDKIQDGQEKLDVFTSHISEYLIDHVKEGVTLNITMRGFASPIGPADRGSYNHALSQRRIDSVRKQFKKELEIDLKERLKENYTAEELKKIMAKLDIKEAAEGDKKSFGILNIPTKGLLARFGHKASKERRVEIVGVKLSKYPCK